MLIAMESMILQVCNFFSLCVLPGLSVKRITSFISIYFLFLVNTITYFDGADLIGLQNR